MDEFIFQKTLEDEYYVAKARYSGSEEDSVYNTYQLGRMEAYQEVLNLFFMVKRHDQRPHIKKQVDEIEYQIGS